MAASTHVEALLKILDLEHSRGYDDAAVLGGLDRYLQVFLQKARESGDPSCASRICPPGFRYSALNLEQRQEWAGQARRTLAGQPPSAAGRQRPASPVPARSARHTTPSAVASSACRATPTRPR